MRALGATVERTGEGAWRIQGVGVGGFASRARPLDFGNSGTGCRLVMGAVAGCPITATFDGDASLRKRPMRRILDPLERMGARALDIARGRAAAGSRWRARAIRSRSSTSRRLPPRRSKSAVLLAGLAAPGETTVIEKEATPRSHREDAHAFRRRGPRRRRMARTAAAITLTGQPELVAGAGRGAGRSVLGRLPDGRGADRAGLRGDPRRRHDQPAAHRPDHDAARDGRDDRDARSAQRRRRGGGRSARARLAAAAASTCRPSARRR